MVENKKRIFLYDKWYYLINETEDKLSYSTKPKNKLDGDLLEFNKKTHEVQIIYFSNGKTLGKLEISSIDNPDMTFHYTQYECHDLIIDKELYTNLLMELFMKSEKGNIDRNPQVIFTKKKKLNKMCYREPKIPLDKKIDLESANLESKMIDNLVEFIPMFPRYREKFIFEEEKETVVNKELNHVISLVIPQDLEVYDRIYHLIESNESKYIYENREDGVNHLEVKIDPISLVLSNINLQIKDNKNNKTDKSVIQIIPNKENGITARYTNRKNLKINLNGTKLEKVKIHAEVIYDSNSRKIGNNIEIEAGKEAYQLNGHPIYKTEYIDSEGNVYRINNGDFARFQGLSNFACGIFKYVEKSFFREKQLMKK